MKILVEDELRKALGRVHEKVAKLLSSMPYTVERDEYNKCIDILDENNKLCYQVYPGRSKDEDGNDEMFNSSSSTLKRISRAEVDNYPDAKLYVKLPKTVSVKSYSSADENLKVLEINRVGNGEILRALTKLVDEDQIITSD